jgi:hypothetical protein
MGQGRKPRKIEPDDLEVVADLLRAVRRNAGYRSVQDAVATSGCPAALQTIYSYERRSPDSLMPTLGQFLDLIEFYVLVAPKTPTPENNALGEIDLRARGIAAVTRALSLPTYQVGRSREMIARMQPDLEDRRATGQDREQP